MLPKTGLVYSRFTAISSGVEVFSSPRKRLFLGGSCISAAVPFRSLLPPAAQSLSQCNPLERRDSGPCCRGWGSSLGSDLKSRCLQYRRLLAKEEGPSGFKIVLDSLRLVW